MDSPADILLGLVGSKRRQTLAELAELEELLADGLAASRERWPDVQLAERDFLAHVAAQLPEQGCDEVLRRLCLEDLYLACACSRGDERANQAFHDLCLPVVRAALSSQHGDAVREEIVQEMLAKMLARDDRGDARIVQYAGRGKLTAWVKIATVRMAQRIVNRERRHDHKPGDAIFERITNDPDPEVQYLKGIYREQLTDALERAFGSLSERDRNVLRYDVIEGLSGDQIGAIYGVNRSSVARWRSGARKLLFDETRRLLNEELALDTTEFHSLVRLVQSQMYIDLGQVLGDDDGV